MNDTELKEGLMIADRYELKQYLGSGSFGEVWLATDTEIGIDLAIKLYISLDKSAQDEFKNEYRVVYGLKEEHLLTADYYGVWQHRPFLIMKYCTNGSAAKLSGKADERTVWQFLHDVAAGLKYLHSLEPPILHQDIKPENILADERGHFLITDFGISRKMRSTMRKQSKRSVGSGALAYMGPERFLNDPMAVKASDIWSLGVSAFELANGDLPFMGQGGGMLLGGAQLPILNRDKWSDNLNDCIQACMAKETWERPTADQLVEYTSLILAGKNVDWKSWFARANGETPDDEAAEPKTAEPAKSRKGLFVILSILAVAALGAGLYWFFAAGGTKSLAAGPDDSADNEAIVRDYTELMSVCRNNIKHADINSYLNLVEARAQLDSLDGIISRHDCLPAGAAADLDELRASFDKKASQIHDKYVEHATRLLAGNEIVSAINYYQIAGLMQNDQTVSDNLTRIAKDKHAAGVFMAVHSAAIDGSTLVISYDGLAPNSINNLVLRYKITDSNGNAVSGEATITLRSGKDRQVSIGMPQAVDPAAGPFTLKLTNNGVFVSETIVE